MSRARRRLRQVAFGAGVVALAAAALWGPIAVPMLVKFPADLDQTTRYEGTFTVHVDPTTGADLPAPIELPLELERRIVTIPEESDASTVVVQEQVMYRVAETEQREVHQYVMDRRSMQNRDDRRSYSYEPANVVDRAGTYRVNLPLGTDPEGRYQIWENEPAAAQGMVGVGREADRDGLRLVEMEEVFEAVPVAGFYLEELRKQGFAVEIGFGVLAAQLQASGVDVEGALAALPPTEATTVADARGTTLPLRFFRSNDGHALVEPTTGAIVDLLMSDEAILATVDLGPLDRLRQALSAAADRPVVDALARALGRLASAPPSVVYELRYRQTDASVQEVVELTKHELAKLDWAERRMPWILAGVGATLVLVSAALRPPRRHRVAPTPSVEVPPRGDPVTTRRDRTPVGAGQ